MFFVLHNEMTADDLMLLKHSRIERLHSFFAPSLVQCHIYVNLQNTLTIHCRESWIVDTLLFDLDDLCDLSWLILGTEAIALFFQKEEIYRKVYKQSIIIFFDEIIQNRGR